MAAPIAWEGSEALVAQCAFCTRFLPGNPPTCAAFPEGIPEEILANEFDHREEVEGDHGLRFDPIDVTASVRAADVIRRAESARAAAAELAEAAQDEDDAEKGET